MSIASLLLPALGGPSGAAPCGGDFNAWLADFKREAVSQGLSQRTIATALGGVSVDPAVLSRDRGQRVFSQTFEQFSGRMISPERLRKGTGLLARYGAVFARIERQFGVPRPVLTAIWGLETDFGINQGRFSLIRSVATLAHDCRRKFRTELFDLLRIVDRRDMAAGELRGDWAGEIGQTQFLPSSYLKFALDFDGDGRRDLIRSAPTRSPRRRTFSRTMAGAAASPGAKEPRTSASCWNGTRPASTPRPSRRSPTGLRRVHDSNRNYGRAAVARAEGRR